MKNIDSQAACLPKSYPQNVNQYLACVTEMALTGLAVIPPIIGSGIRLGSKGKIKISKSGKKKDNISKVESIEELNELKSPNQQRSVHDLFKITR